MVMLQNQYSEENPHLGLFPDSKQNWRKNLYRDCENSFEQKWLNEVMGSCSVKRTVREEGKKSPHKNIFI